MPDIEPLLRLDIGGLRDVFGWVRYPGDFLSWDILGYLPALSSSFAGFVADPTNSYVMQASAPAWFDNDETQWTSTSGTYGHGTGTADLGGKKYLRQTSSTGAFSTVNNFHRTAEEGLTADFFIGTTPAGGSPSNFYIQFNTTLRLALEPGQPIRLQTKTGSTWTDAAVASALGECETYLASGPTRKLLVDVLPETDPTWAAGFPGSSALSDSPPNTICVTINGGDAVLTIPATTFPAGQLTITGQNRQWSCALAKKRFIVNASASLPTLARPRPFLTPPTPRLGGYIPVTGGTGSASLSIGLGTLPNQAAATVSVNAAAFVDSTGYATKTVYLRSAEADFPSLQQPPSPAPFYTTYINNVVKASWRWEHDPLTNTTRGQATVTLSNADLSLTPAQVSLAAKAAQLSVSLDGGVNWVPVITGRTAINPRGGEGASWSWENGLPYFEITITDRLALGDSAACGYLPPFDRTCHYYALRTLLRRMGITDDRMDFPLVARGDVTPYYYLPGGTNAAPALQFEPGTTLGECAEHIRSMSAELDSTGTVPLPMALVQDAYGNVGYFPLPVGVINTWQNPGLPVTLPQTIIYSAQPLIGSGGAPRLNEILNSGLRSWADLSIIRSPVVYEGVDLTTGDAVIGFAYNERVGGGPYSDPSAPGFIGDDVPFYVISRLVSSAGYAAYLAAAAANQLALPAIGCDLRLHAQPRLMPLTIIGVQDYATQGTYAPVPYYVTAVESEIDLTGPVRREETRVAARLLGQAGG